MLGPNVLSDLEADTLPSILQSQTPWGCQTLLSRLQNPDASIAELKRRQLPLLALRNRACQAELGLLRSELTQSIAPHCSLLDPAPTKPDTQTLVEESVEQILWSPKSWISMFNTYPKILNGLITWKTIIVPLISVVMPIVAMILPFFLLQYTTGSSMSVSDYMSHVRAILLKQISIPNFMRSRHSGDTLGYIFETGFLLLTVGTFVSGLWNQIQSALHLRTIAADLVERGNSLRAVVESATRMLEILKSLPTHIQKGLRQCIETGTKAVEVVSALPAGLAGYGTFWNNPAQFAPLRDWIGQMDAYVTLAGLSDICFPRFQTNSALSVTGLYHPSLQTERRILNSAEFSKQPHVLLTGPNRGGKSTFCKSLGLSILYAQSWGIAWATSMTMTPFAGIETALSPADVLGKLSLFEAEIEFAKRVLGRCRQSDRVFVMMDEIFHSTNAQDGVAASRIFLSQMYDCAGVTSLISTHYRELVSEFKERVQPWAMKAELREDGSLHYLYQVEEGVSDKSSVMEILKERGFTTCG